MSIVEEGIVDRKERAKIVQDMFDVAYGVLALRRIYLIEKRTFTCMLQASFPMSCEFLPGTSTCLSPSIYR